MDPILTDALTLLMEIDRERLLPDAAWTRFESLRRAHPERKLELVWEREGLGDSYHYDILWLADQGTVSLSWCPDRETPWPMRGVQRWTESYIVRVDGDVMHVGEALGSLEHLWQRLDVPRHLVDTLLVNRALRDGEITVGDEELAAALHEFRVERRLFGAKEVCDWMAAHGTSQAQLEAHLGLVVARRKLRERVAAGRVEARFASARESLATVKLARLVIEDADEVRLLAQRLREHPGGFYDLAQTRFVAGSGGGVLFVERRRRDLDEARATALFQARQGEVVGPFATGEGHELALVLGQRAAELDAGTRALIEEELFDEWLGERRRAARIEWFWGS